MAHTLELRVRTNLSSPKLLFSGYFMTATEKQEVPFLKNLQKMVSWDADWFSPQVKRIWQTMGGSLSGWLLSADSSSG